MPRAMEECHELGQHRERPRARCPLCFSAGQRIRITAGHGDCTGATGVLIRPGARRQWWVELDEPWRALRPDGLTWVWAEEMEKTDAQP